MRIRIPGTQCHIRLFEAVATKDNQYQIYDVGIEYDHGGIDSIAVGGSAYSAKEAIKNLDKKGLEKKVKKAKKTAKKAAEKEAVKTQETASTASTI